MAGLTPRTGVRHCAVCMSTDTVSMYVEGSSLTECLACDYAGPSGELVATGARAHEYANPRDHHMYQALDCNSQHIVDHWNQAHDSEREQGKRWYSDAKIVSDALAHHTGHTPNQVAGTMSAYSPQVEWGANLHNAAKSLHQGWPVGIGEGVNVMQSHHDAAKKMMIHGEDHQTALGGPKTNAFAHLIEHGGMDPDNPGKYSQRVCVDRHAMSVASGFRYMGPELEMAKPVLKSHHYYKGVEGMYQDAARQISHQMGYEVAPHQVQATTWMVRKRLNSEEDGNERMNKAIDTNQNNNRDKWRKQYHNMGMGDSLPLDNMHATRRHGYNEVKAPGAVDTLRDEECPICGDSSSFNGNECRICGFVQPPEQFRDPDVELARRLDLHKDETDPSGMSAGDVAKIEDSINDADRDGIDDASGEPMNAKGEDPEAADLVCPVCGKTFQSTPMSTSMKNPSAGGLGVDDPEQAAEEGVGDGNAAEGDPCPNCGQGVLAKPSDAQAEDGMAPEDDAEQGEEQDEEREFGDQNPDDPDEDDEDDEQDPREQPEDDEEDDDENDPYASDGDREEDDDEPEEDDDEDKPAFLRSKRN